MSYLLGLDLGTSSLKCLLAQVDGRVVAVSEREYPINYPTPGQAEQDPDTWWSQAVDAIREVIRRAGIRGGEVQAVGLSGQMHGAVLLGADQRPIRPAIIWPDQRSSAQCQQVYDQVGADRLARIAGSGVFTGFMLASLLWVKEQEPQVWDQVRTVLFPKDYLRLRLTGEAATEVTDASGGLLLDIHRRDWSQALSVELGIPSEVLPPLHESREIAGQITAEAAQVTGLAAGTPVIAGAADQASGALGSGVIEAGIISATVGTGGQLVTAVRTPQIDDQLRIHTFCHALPQTWYLLGATLSAGLAFRWLRDSVIGEEAGQGGYQRMTAQAVDVPVGAGGLLFFPYLLGERTVDIPTRGLFFGLTPEHGQAHLIRAVMEGIVFSMRRMLGVFDELGVEPVQVVAMGGGARSPLWCQMIADIFQAPVMPLAVAEQSALGAAILAGLGIGAFPDVQSACRVFVKYGSAFEPDGRAAAVYEDLYGLFNTVYEKVKPDLARLSQL